MGFFHVQKVYGCMGLNMILKLQYKSNNVRCCIYNKTNKVIW